MTGPRTIPLPAAARELPPCPTIARLTALQPGEAFRYLSLPAGKGYRHGAPLYNALIDAIMDCAHGLALAGRVRLTTREYTLKKGRDGIAIKDFIAVGIARGQR